MSVLGITLKEAQDWYRKYMEAELLILKSERYRIADNELQRTSLEKVVEGKKYWEQMCIKLSGGHRRRTTSIIPR